MPAACSDGDEALLAVAVPGLEACRCAVSGSQRLQEMDTLETSRAALQEAYHADPISFWTYGNRGSNRVGADDGVRTQSRTFSDPSGQREHSQYSQLSH